MNLRWKQNPAVAQQGVHFLIGLSSIVTTVYFFGGWKAAAVAYGALVAFAAFVEFYIDARYERDPPQTWKDNATDFTFYVLGGAAGLALVLIHTVLGLK